MVTKHTVKLCLVIGDPVAQSMSPAMHNAAYRELGIDSEYLFEAVKVPAESLEKFVEMAKKTTHFMAVTIPHKEAIISLLDRVDKTAKAIGAVNSVLNIKDRLVGYNTDYLGAINSLKQVTALGGKSIAILGSGGSARAIVYGLVKAKSNVTIYSRNNAKAIQLAKVFSCKAVAWENRNAVKKADIIINTTPLGKNDDNLPIDESLIHPQQIIFDINYIPGGTGLLKAAKRRKAGIVIGHEMLLRQGMSQFEIYTGLKAPEEVMRKALNIKPTYASTI